MQDRSRTLSVEILQKYKNPYFVESGSHKGGGIQTALDAGFENIISVEISELFYKHCKERFSNNREVSLYLGDTAVILGDIIKNIHHPITFWLDGHVNYDGGFGIAPVPLLGELLQIGSHHLNIHTIIIDDRRLMGKIADNWVSDYWENTTEEKVYKALKMINPEYAISYEWSPHGEEDIIVARPK